MGGALLASDGSERKHWSRFPRCGKRLQSFHRRWSFSGGYGPLAPVAEGVALAPGVAELIGGAPPSVG